jgi:type III restriction enzyme
MSDRLIENPIINSPYAEPTKHFRFDDEGITNQVINGRRTSSYFMPIAKSRKNRQQLKLDIAPVKERNEENKLINKIRERVSLWRKGGYQGVEPTTRMLLNYWTHPEREKKLFFCQIEAIETAIYLTECAKKFGDNWMDNELRAHNEGSNPGLYRIAFKMATGTGKTVVMALLIAWQALNKLEKPQDARFTDSFLLIAPGITIRDRLRVLLPSDPNNYYRQRDILPPELLEKLGRTKISIINFHTFKLKETVDASKLTKLALSGGTSSNLFTETPEQMVRRVCRELGTKKNIIVINDEAHHCYRRKPDADEEVLTGDEGKEAKQREEQARIWISGIEAIKAKLGVKVVYDLSATPFFLKGSGWTEGSLFPWVVSDFSLIDAIESGIVKVPRVPVSDDSMMGEMPTYRHLWERIKDGLPKKGRGTQNISGDPKLPAELQAAIHSLYGNYEKAYQRWKENEDAQAKGLTPPVFIVVCNNTNVSKLVYDYISGYERTLSNEQKVLVPGHLEIFSNVKDERWLSRPNTILVDSEQLESGEAMSDDFKKMAKREIEEFKAEYRLRFPGRDAEKLSDEDILREVMNTVGKPGKLGEHIKCVVSVSMLTEGWDANTVTHILGVRAFGTQLLCEQVVGRGLRRMSYAVNDEGYFEPEYAEVYGVPFSFIPCSGSSPDPKPGPIPTRVRSLEERIHLEMTFPRLLGYRFDLPEEDIGAVFNEESQMALSTQDVPTRVENAPIVGEISIHTLDDLKARRVAEVAFLLTKQVYENYFRESNTGEPQDKPWLFPKILPLVKQWLSTCLFCKDNTFPQYLLLLELANNAADKIYRAIVRYAKENQTASQPVLKPILRPYDPMGSTRYVDFDTTRPTYRTNANKCHISHVVADTDSWEQKMAEVLEEMPEVLAYAKNHNLGFTIPYTFDGETRQYIPDFLVSIQDGHPDPLNLIIEVTGERKKDKAAKVETARTLWIPAVNNHGGLGRWQFIEIADPWDAKTTIRAKLAQEATCV